MDAVARLSELKSLIGQSKAKRGNFSFNQDQNSPKYDLESKQNDLLVDLMENMEAGKYPETQREPTGNENLSKRGRPRKEHADKKMKRPIYLDQFKERRIKALYGKGLSPSVSKIIDHFFILKERESKQVDVLKKLLKNFSEDLKILNLELNKIKTNPTDNEFKKLKKSIDISGKRVKDYASIFKISDLSEIREYFNENEFNDLVFALSRAY